jgi:hypothetical protein
MTAGNDGEITLSRDMKSGARIHPLDGFAGCRDKD